MKIAYLLSHDITKNDGVTKKILGQTTEWRKEGNKVEIYCLVPCEGKSIVSGVKQYKLDNALKSRFISNKDLLSNLNIFNPDIVYFRYFVWTKTLSVILNKYKVITELNTDDSGEFFLLLKKEKTFKSFFRYYANKLLRLKVLSKASGIVAVTKEIAMHSDNIKYLKKTIVIPNGIDLEKYNTIKNTINNSERIGLFFIGTPNQPWHGVDIIENMAKKMPEYDFHIVGMEGNCTPNLFWHGYLPKEKYIEILKKCHFCIGTLALYRNGMQEACPLKVREYLAYGYPTVIGYKDTAFHKSTYSWLFKINTQNNIDNYEELKKDLLLHKNVIVPKSDIEDKIGTFILERKRINFLNKFL